jgi:hypothetical protein
MGYWLPFRSIPTGNGLPGLLLLLTGWWWVGDGLPATLSLCTGWWWVGGGLAMGSQLPYWANSRQKFDQDGSLIKFPQNVRARTRRVRDHASYEAPQQPLLTTRTSILLALFSIFLTFAKLS